MGLGVECKSENEYAEFVDHELPLFDVRKLAWYHRHGCLWASCGIAGEIVADVEEIEVGVVVEVGGG